MTMTIPAPFEQRVARLRALLNECGGDLFLADHGELMAWLTGYTVSETMYRAVLVGRDAAPWMVLRDLDAPQASHQGWLADVEGYRDWDDPFAAVAGSIRDRGFESARIVADSASYSFTVHAQARLQTELPDAVFIHRPGVSDRLRAVKDDSEIALLRQAARIADRSMERLCEGVGPGVTVRQAGALAASSYLEYGADDGHAGRICRGAGATGFLHAELDDHPLQVGDVLHAELVPSVKRYSTRIMRPIAIVSPHGRIPPAPQALVERLVFHQDRQIAAMAAGAKASDVDAVLREALLGEGIRDRYDNVHRLHAGDLRPHAALQRLLAHLRACQRLAAAGGHGVPHVHLRRRDRDQRHGAGHRRRRRLPHPFTEAPAGQSRRATHAARVRRHRCFSSAVNRRSKSRGSLSTWGATRMALSRTLT